MAGTDTRRQAILGGPAVILVTPQLGQNIGAAARAMLNFGLTDLRLVAPRDGWPNEQAIASASGADRVLEEARVFPTTREAVADLHRLYATTARPRELIKPVLTPRAAAIEMRDMSRGGAGLGLMFGPERTGLANEDVVLADAILSVPLNPAFSSLNLAQAVLLVAYEWFQAGDETPAQVFDMRETRLANRAELHGLFDHLEGELEEVGFFDNVRAKQPSMLANIRTILQRGPLLEQDVRTLRGVIKAIAGRRVPGSKKPGAAKAPKNPEKEGAE